MVKLDFTLQFQFITTTKNGLAFNGRANYISSSVFRLVCHQPPSPSGIYQGNSPYCSLAESTGDEDSILISS